MPVTTTIRKHTADGTGATNQAFTIPFTIDEEDHLYVYEGDNLKELTRHYTITQEGIKLDGSSQQCVVTWVGATIAPGRGGATVYTFIRLTPKTQPEDGRTVTKGNQFERGLGRLALQAQESLYATLDVYDAGSNLIQRLGTPVEDADMANYLYAQARYSTTTNKIPPALHSKDENKYLYMEEAGKVVWKDPFLPPQSTGGSGRVLNVSESGETQWVATPTEAPSNPLVPSFLSVNSGGSAIEWRDISDLPPTETQVPGVGIISQEGGTVAWEEVRDIPPLPVIENASSMTFVLNLWMSSYVPESTTSVSIGKTTFIRKLDPTYNYGASTLMKTMASSSGNHLNALMEVDVSSNNFDVNKIVKAEIKLYLENAVATDNDHTMCIGRMKTTWTEGSGSGSATGDGATWQTYDGSNAWLGGDGALNDIDYDMHIYPAYVKGKASGGIYADDQHHTYDITHLLIDAIENRSGVLNISMFAKSNASTSVWHNWGSDDNSTSSKRPTLEVTLSSEGRSEKWAAVSWGDVTVGHGVFFNTESTRTYDSDGDTHEIMQPHMVRQALAYVNHNMGLYNLLGVCSVKNNDVHKEISGSPSDHTTVYFHTAISPNNNFLGEPPDPNKGRIWVWQSDNMFGPTSLSTIGAYSGDLTVSYVIWSDTPEFNTPGNSSGGAC